MAALLGILVAIHICWPIWYWQLHDKPLQRANWLLAFLFAALDLGFMASQLDGESGRAILLFSAVPAAIYLFAFLGENSHKQS